MFRIRPYIGKAFMHFIFNNISQNILQEAVTRKFVYTMPITCAHLLNIFFLLLQLKWMTVPMYSFWKQSKLAIQQFLYIFFCRTGEEWKYWYYFAFVAITCLDDLANNKNLLLFRLSTNNGAECWMILLTRWFF